MHWEDLEGSGGEGGGKGDWVGNTCKPMVVSFQCMTKSTTIKKKKKRKAMTNLDSILKSRDNALPTKVCIVQAMVFTVVMYRHESWTIKKAKH